MGGTPKVIMGALLIMVVSLALVLGLLLVLLAELYCSLLLRPRQLRKTTTSAAATTEPPWQQEEHHQSAASSLSNFYAQGVLQAPRSFLFPSVSNRDIMDMEKQHSSPPSPTPFAPFGSRKLVQEVPLPCSTSTISNDTICRGGYNKEQIMYISNPVFDNEACRASKVDNTPFETPDTSPSRLDSVGSSEEEDDIGEATPSSSPSSTPLTTPRLTPMKKLPAEACSVSLRDAGLIGTSCSDSNSNNNDGVSLSSSATPCTSLSW